MTPNEFWQHVDRGACGHQFAGDRDHAEVEHRGHLADQLVKVES